MYICELCVCVGRGGAHVCVVYSTLHCELDLVTFSVLCCVHADQSWFVH